MNLHNEIMNIQLHLPELGFQGIGAPLAYKIGHREARHASAELSLKAQARTEELEATLERAFELLNRLVNPFAKGTNQSRHTDILNFLRENKQ